MEVQSKCCLVDTLKRLHLPPMMNYGISIIDEDEFIDALLVRVSCPGILSNDVVKCTTDADVLCLSCADGIWLELKSVFKTDQLSKATKQLLTIIHRSGWSMVNLDWEDNLLVLIRDRATAEKCDYWQFLLLWPCQRPGEVWRTCIWVGGGSNVVMEAASVEFGPWRGSAA